VVQPGTLIHNFGDFLLRVSTPQIQLTKPYSMEPFLLNQPTGSGRLAHLANANLSYGWSMTVTSCYQIHVITC
jgi:hypothetical protein